MSPPRYGVVRAARERKPRAFRARVFWPRGSSRDERASLVTRARRYFEDPGSEGSDTRRREGRHFGTPRGERAVASPSCTSSVGVDARRAREAAVGARYRFARARTRSVVSCRLGVREAMSNDTSASPSFPEPPGHDAPFPPPAPYVPPAAELHADVARSNPRAWPRRARTGTTTPCVCAGMWITSPSITATGRATRPRRAPSPPRRTGSSLSCWWCGPRCCSRRSRRSPTASSRPPGERIAGVRLPEDVAGATLLALGGAAPDIFTQAAAIAESATPDARLAISESVGASTRSPPRATRWPSSSGSAPRRARRGDCRSGDALAAVRENHRLTSWRWTAFPYVRDAMAYGGLIAVTATSVADGEISTFEALVFVAWHAAHAWVVLRGESVWRRAGLTVARRRGGPGGGRARRRRGEGRGDDARRERVRGTASRRRPRVSSSSKTSRNFEKSSSHAAARFRASSTARRTSAISPRRISARSTRMSSANGWSARETQRKKRLLLFLVRREHPRARVVSARRRDARGSNLSRGARARPARARD